MKKYRVLVVDDEPDMLRACRKILESKCYSVETASDGPEALKFLQEKVMDVLIVDLHLPSMDGLDVMREALRFNRDIAVLVITAYANVDTAVQAVRDGAFDFIPKPFSAAQLEVVVERSLTHRQLVDQNRLLQREMRRIYKFENVVAHSSQMTAVLDLVRKVGPTEASVLLLGESGTGKELIARCLHDSSSRNKGPFVPIDCSSLPEALLESELFGYDKGAFTGAVTGRAGLLESANGGTIFLDEIGNVSPNLQAKLLRVLEERQYRRLGGRSLLELDARFLSATNRELEDMVQQGTFREDLFYRLNVVRIGLPALRERPADLAPLAQFFLSSYPDTPARNIRGISSAALLALQNYRWPGNVRELKNVIWRAVSLAEGNQITPLDLPPDILSTEAVASVPRGEFRKAKQQVVDQFERSYFQQLMTANEGNVSQAAREGGMKRSVLHRLLHKHKLDPSVFRPGRR